MMFGGTPSVVKLLYMHRVIVFACYVCGALFSWLLNSTGVVQMPMLGPAETVGQVEQMPYHFLRNGYIAIMKPRNYECLCLTMCIIV